MPDIEEDFEEFLQERIDRLYLDVRPRSRLYKILFTEEEKAQFHGRLMELEAFVDWYNENVVEASASEDSDSND